MDDVEVALNGVLKAVSGPKLNRIDLPEGIRSQFPVLAGMCRLYSAAISVAIGSKRPLEEARTIGHMTSRMKARLEEQAKKDLEWYRREIIAQDPVGTFDVHEPASGSVVTSPVESAAKFVPTPPPAKALKAYRVDDIPRGCEEFMILRSLSNQATVTYLSKDHRSWLIHCPNFLVPTLDDFQTVWQKHPPQVGRIFVNGIEYSMRRYNQTFGQSYSFSGQTLEAAPIDSIPQVAAVVDSINRIAENAALRYRYRMCLVNWYEPGHHINPHSDDEPQIIRKSPIFSISWGQTRIFRFTSRIQERGIVQTADFLLGNGDLAIMGGELQMTHKHEIPPVPVEELARTSTRINFTLRSFMTV